MRLFRPHIPLWVRCTVAARQVGFVDTGMLLTLHQGHHGALLVKLLGELADKLQCAVEELRLDHNPALALRMKRTVGHPPRHVYSPDANDPAHLEYRPHGAEHAGSHDVKTRIRGEHGQYSDVVLIKRQRRRERAQTVALENILKKKRRVWRSVHKAKIPSRPFPTGRGFPKRRKP